MEPHRDISTGVRVTIIGAAVNIILGIIKLTAGLAYNSSSLIADAIHSISDLITDVVVYVSLKISSRQPDEGHPYGHGRAETIGSAIVGGVVILVGLGIIWEVLGIVLVGTIPRPDVAAIWAAIASIAGKELLFRYTKKVGESIRSESIVANAWHHRSDAMSSVAVVLGIAGSAAGFPLMDSLAAVVVGMMIAKAGWDITYESINNLMDRGVSPEELKQIEEIVGRAKGVVDHHELKTRKVGSDTFVDIHIQVSPKISVSEAHNIAEAVRKELKEKVQQITDALVHIDAEEDLQGRHYKVARQPVEDIIKRTIADYGGAELDDEIILHFLYNSICADVTVKLDDALTISEAKRIALDIAQKIIEKGTVTEVTVRHNLGDIVKGGKG